MLFSRLLLFIITYDAILMLNVLVIYAGCFDKGYVSENLW